MAGHRTTYAYDGFENLVLITADSGFGGLNLMTRYGYDTLGDQTSVTDPRGNTTTSAYDADRRLTTVTAPAPFNTGAALVQTQTTYDPDGRILSVSHTNNGALVTSSSTYTPSGQVATTVDGDGTVTTYAYDVVDRLASRTDPMGRVTTYAYDAMSRRTEVSNPAIQATPLAQFAYGPDGETTTVTDAKGAQVGFAYDGFDRLETTAYPDGSMEQRTYDADSNLLTKVTRAGVTITYQYDTLNRRSAKLLPPGSGESSVQYAYDLDGRPTAVTTSNDTTIPAPTTVATYATDTSYDALNRPVTVTWNPAPDQAPVTYSTTSFAFSYDASNRRTSQTATDNSWWQYPSTTPSSVSYVANNLNQYSAVASIAPTYDQNGDLTYDGTFTYAYDPQGRLLSITEGGTGVASYTWDGRGRRRSSTIGGTGVVYVTDADNRDVLEYNTATGAVERWYAYGQGPNAVLSQMNVAAGTRETLIPDIQGSIIGMLDSGSGTLTTAGNQPYGESASLLGTFRFTGQRLDPETGGSTAQPSGLYYYRARMYSPTWGRFLQPDPLNFGGGLNLYAYVNNDPLNLTDPSGNIALIDNLVGAGVGVGVDLFAQYVQARVAGQPFQVDWTRTAVAAGAGFVTSGASALLGEGVSSLGLGAASSFALRTAGNAAIGAAGNVGSTAALNGLEGNNDSLTTAAIAGGGFGALGSVAGDVVTGIGPASAQAQYNALSAGEKNLVNGVADLSGVDLFAPTPAFVTGGVIAGSAVSGGTSFIGGSGTSNTGK